MDGGDGGRLRSSPERRASTDLCDAPPMSVGQQVRSAKPYRPSRLQESARSGVLSIYEDITAERGSSEAYILSMFSGRERSAAERREGASARQSWLRAPTFETAHTTRTPGGDPGVNSHGSPRSFRSVGTGRTYMPSTPISRGGKGVNMEGTLLIWQCISSTASSEWAARP